MKNFLHSKNIIIPLCLFVVAVFAVFFFVQNQNDKKNYNADLIIQDVTILTLNEKSEIIKDGWIAVKNGEIIELGSGGHNYLAKEIIYAKGKIAMPGLINAHSHVAMTLFRGAGDELNLPDWIFKMSEHERKLVEEDFYWGALLGEIEMVKSGTTTFNDMYFSEEAIVKSAKETGMRLVIDIPFDFENDKVEIDKSFINDYKNFSTISFSIAPNPLINFSENGLAEIKKAILDNDFVLHIHIEEGKNEKNDFVKKYGYTPLEMLSNADLLNNKIAMAHAVNFTDEEFKIISKYPNIGIVINPKTNFKLSGYSASLAEMMEYNLILGIGTDGAGSSNSLDLFDQINLIAFAIGKCDSDKSYCENRNNIYPEKIIRMATIDGAKVLGLDKEIGSLEVGKRADVILIDFNKVELTPSYNIYSSLVYNTDGSDVTDSIIDGKVVMRDRKLINLNEREVANIIKKVNEVAEKIKKSNLTKIVK